MIYIGSRLRRRRNVCNSYAAFIPAIYGANAITTNFYTDPAANIYTDPAANRYVWTI